jgi:hypothetical protein
MEAINKIKTQLSNPPPSALGHFVCLPQELLIQILWFVGPKEVGLYVSLLSKQFLEVASDDWLWHRFSVSDLTPKKIESYTNESSWKQFYQTSCDCS